MASFERESAALEAMVRVSGPTLLTQSEGDPIGVGAAKLFEALTVPQKTLLRFTSAEGAGGHCEATTRRLFHQRVYDWLDETLDGRTPADAEPLAVGAVA